MVTALDLIRQIESRGGRFEVQGDMLVAAPRESVPEDLVPLIGEYKPAIMAALRDRAVHKRRASTADIEWSVEACCRFTTLVAAKAEVEKRLGACISCGARWDGHGRPDVASWRRVADANDIEVIGMRYVLASARALVTGPRS